MVNRTMQTIIHSEMIIAVGFKVNSEKATKKDEQEQRVKIDGNDLILRKGLYGQVLWLDQVLLRQRYFFDNCCGGSYKEK